MVTCAICGKSFRVITNSHLSQYHGTTPSEYVRLYGGHLISEETVLSKSLAARSRKLPSKYDGFDWEQIGFGQKPDRMIAEETGIPKTTLTKIRNKLGIPAFTGVILNQEGDPCRSIYEAMYDAVLHWQNIAHQHEVRVENLPYIADFKVENQFIEIAGMKNFSKYDNKLSKKVQIYEDAGIQVTWLSREQVEELYKECPITINFREHRICERCGKQTHDLVKNVCRKCYMYVWREESTATGQCQECGNLFSLPLDKPNQKFCSHECYSASLAFDWPSWEWIEDQLKTTSIRQLAFRIGVKAPTMYMHIRRRKKRNNGSLT